MKIEVTFIAALITLLTCNVCFSQNFRKTVGCEDSAFTSFKRNLDICTSTSTEITGSLRCNIDAWKSYANATCMNSIRAGAANQIFIQQQMLAVEQDLENKKISKAKEDEQWRKLVALYKVEYQTILDDMKKEFDDLHEQQIATRNRQFISFAVNALGGVQQTQKNPSTTTYMINNRLISCTNTGSFVSCN